MRLLVPERQQSEAIAVLKVKTADVGLEPGCSSASLPEFINVTGHILNIWIDNCQWIGAPIIVEKKWPKKINGLSNNGQIAYVNSSIRRGSLTNGDSWSRPPLPGSSTGIT